MTKTIKQIVPNYIAIEDGLLFLDITDEDNLSHKLILDAHDVSTLLLIFDEAAKRVGKRAAELHSLAWKLKL